MKENIENLKDQFIIDETEYPEEKLAPLMEILLEFLRVTKEGEILIIKNVPTRKILPLIISARFIAHKLNKEIGEEISKEDLLKYSLLKDNVFNVRLNELLREGIGKKENNKIKARNIFLVEGFLYELKDKSKRFLTKTKKQTIKQGTLNTDKKIVEEKINLSGKENILPLKEYLKKTNPKSYREKTLIMADYITKINNSDTFSEGQILYAYTKLGENKPRAFHQMFLDIEQEKKWIIKRNEKQFLWEFSDAGKDYLNKIEKNGS